MKQIGFHNLNFALGVCSGPQGPVIDLPIFGEAASSREGLGGSQPLSIWRPACPFGGLGAPNPCPFGDRHVHLEGWPTFGDRLSMWKPPCPFRRLGAPLSICIWRVGGPLALVRLETALSIWRVGGPPTLVRWETALSIWSRPTPKTFRRTPEFCPANGLRLSGEPLGLSGEPLKLSGKPLGLGEPLGLEEPPEST